MMRVLLPGWLSTWGGSSTSRDRGAEETAAVKAARLRAELAQVEFALMAQSDANRRLPPLDGDEEGEGGVAEVDDEEVARELRDLSRAAEGEFGEGRGARDGGDYDDDDTGGLLRGHGQASDYLDTTKAGAARAVLRKVWRVLTTRIRGVDNDHEGRAFAETAEGRALEEREADPAFEMLRREEEHSALEDALPASSYILGFAVALAILILAYYLKLRSDAANADDWPPWEDDDKR